MVQVESLVEDLILVDSTVGVVGSVGIPSIGVGIRGHSPSIRESIVGVGIRSVDITMVGPSITESRVGIRISLTSEVRELRISIRFSFSHETPVSFKVIRIKV